MGVEISGSPCTISDIGFVLFLPQDPIPLTTLAKRLESISNIHGIVTEPPFPKIYRGKPSFTFTIVARKTRCHSNLVAIHYLPLSLTPFIQPTNSPVETLDGATLLRYRAVNPLIRSCTKCHASILVELHRWIGEMKMFLSH